MSVVQQNTDRTLIPCSYYTEGPVVDQEGNFYFTTLGGGTICKISGDNTCSLWATTACPNGQVILSEGEHLVCDSQLAAVSRFSKEGQFLGHRIQGSCGGKAISCPNDLIVDSRGGVYFTDSVRHEGKVAYISAEGQEYILAEHLDYPNGLALSKDEKFLFVAESYKNRILIFRLEADEQADDGFEVFADLPRHAGGDISMNLPDGIKVDRYGNVWIAHYGMGALQVLDSHGKLLQTIETGLPLTSNLFLTDTEIIITGGYGEPGPGAVIRMPLIYEKEYLNNLSSDENIRH